MAGRTLIDACGEREGLWVTRAEEVIEFEVEDVDEALEWVWT